MARYEIWPFAPALFLADTKGMSNAQVGAYLKLLCFYWVNRALPTDDDELRRITDMGPRTWQRNRARIKRLFDGNWRHRRVERDLRAAAAFHKQKRTAANSRWHPYEDVDNGDDNFGKMPSFTSANPLENNNPKYAGAMRLRKNLENPFGTSGSADVDKFQNPLQTSKVVSSVPKGNNATTQALRLSNYQRAQQIVLRALLHQLGVAAYADAIDVLALDPQLLDRATRAEQRKRGSGVMAALTGLRRHVKSAR